MKPLFDQKGFSKECGLRLAIARKIHGTTQLQFSKRIGISRAQLANIEAGRCRMYVDVLWRAAVVFGVNITKLIPERASQSKTKGDQT